MSEASLDISVPGFELPASSFVSEEAKKELVAQKISVKKMVEEMADSSVSLDLRGASREELPAIREAMISMCKSSSSYLNMQSRFPTTMHEEVMDGVLTEVFTPTNGIDKKNTDRVLINLHGGSFMGGERSGSHLESIPIASVGKIKVVSVDYRMAPEYHFPAASDDVLNVYKCLLKDYAPENIGIYGSSAGALLTAQVVALIKHDQLPKPGAVAMLAAAAYYWMEGDSGHIGCAITGISAEGSQLKDDLYFKDTDPKDPLAFPGRDSAVMADFPPSLLVASTRDFALSSVVKTHTQLINQGVESDLHIWDGLDHVFYCNSELPESQEVYKVVINFFKKHLN